MPGTCEDVLAALRAGASPLLIGGAPVGGMLRGGHYTGSDAELMRAAALEAEPEPVPNPKFAVGEDGLEERVSFASCWLKLVSCFFAFIGLLLLVRRRQRPAEPNGALGGPTDRGRPPEGVGRRAHGEPCARQGREGFRR